MTRKDYVKIAEVLKDARTANAHDTVDYIADKLAGVLRADNPRFDNGRFIAATKVTP